MPQTLPLPYEPTPNRKRWTRRECRFLTENGLLTGRYELIDGEIISQMGQNPPHAYVVVRLTAYLIGVFGADFVRMQLPIDVAESDNETNEPEPDGAVLSRPASAYLSGNPGPADLRLVADFSDSTRGFDLRTKAALYARAGIAEYWVIDLVDRRVIVHRSPAADSGYSERVAYAADEPLAPLAAPESPVPVASLLPPVAAE